jgi:hypothetical protein
MSNLWRIRKRKAVDGHIQDPGASGIDALDVLAAGTHGIRYVPFFSVRRRLDTRYRETITGEIKWEIKRMKDSGIWQAARI